MATYGRKVEIDTFLKSIEQQQYDTSQVEIIIVDQNEKIVLDDICDRHSARLNIKHIKSDKKEYHLKYYSFYFLIITFLVLYIE